MDHQTSKQNPDDIIKIAMQIMGGDGFDNIDFHKTPKWLDDAIHTYISKIITANLRHERPLGLFLQGPSKTGKTYAILRLVCKLLYDTSLGFSGLNLTYSLASDVVSDLLEYERIKSSAGWQKDQGHLFELENRLFPQSLDIECGREYNPNTHTVKLKTYKAKPVKIIDDINNLFDGLLEEDNKKLTDFEKTKRRNELGKFTDYIDLLKRRGTILIGTTNIDMATKQKQIGLNDGERLWGRIHAMCYVIAAPPNVPTMQAEKL